MSVRGRTVTVERKPRMISSRAEVIAGPETAARLGVPVGTIVETREARWYRNPLLNVLWRLRHPRAGRINFGEGSVV